MLLNNRCMDKTDNSYKKAYESKSMEKEYCCDNQFQGVVCDPIYECPQVRCTHREIYHEVPHIIPVETKIINHHIYRHTYQPTYSCCEENEVCNVYDNKCGF